MAVSTPPAYTPSSQLLEQDETGLETDSDDEADKRKWKCCRIASAILVLVWICLFGAYWWLTWQLVPIPDGYCEEISAALPHVPDIDNLSSIKDWADRLVDMMNPEEKRRLVNGFGFPVGYYSPPSGFYVGNTLAVPRLGIPSLRMQDAGQGVRTVDDRMIGEVTAWPCSLAGAASWDEDAIFQWAAAMGEEFKGKGANVALGPGVNVHRTARGGRNAEYISGEDLSIWSEKLHQWTSVDLPTERIEIFIQSSSRSCHLCGGFTGEHVEPMVACSTH